MSNERYRVRIEQDEAGRPDHLTPGKPVYISGGEWCASLEHTEWMRDNYVRNHGGVATIETKGDRKP